MVKIVPFLYKDVDDFFANTYLLIDDKNSCVVIDPSVDTPKLGDYIVKNNLSLKAVLLTHTHFDHMRGINALIKRFHVKLYVGFDDLIGLTDYTYNLSGSRHQITLETDGYPLSDNEELCFLEEKIKVIYTPFHTLGSVCYYFSNSKILISGDTLFKGSIGRSDFKSSNKRLIRSSLEKLYSLPDDVKVYPGHGPFTTILQEKNTNLFLKNN